MRDDSGMDSGVATADRVRLSSERTSVWLVACAICLLVASLVAGALVVNRLLTRDLAAARARDARLPILETAVEQRPDDAGARLQLGHAYQQDGLYREASKQYKKVLSTDPGNLGALYNTAVIQFKTGQSSAGERTLSEVLALSPSHALAAYDLAQRYIDAGKPDRALSVVIPAVEAHPDYADLQYVAGLAYEKSGQVGEAAVRYGAALELVPDMPEARSALSRVGGGE